MSTDLSSNIMRQIDSQPPRRPPGLPRALAATVSAVVVIGLFILLVTHFHQPSYGGDDTTTPPPTATPLHCPGQTGTSAGVTCPVTDKGITIQVIDANVSSLSSTIQIRITGPASKINRPNVLDCTLTDGMGNILMSHSGGYNGKIPNDVTGTLFFPPLPTTELQSPLHLTLTITRLYPSMPPAPFVYGTWRSVFNVTPANEFDYPIHMQPVVTNGIGIQAQSLEAVPTGETPNGGMGGVRLELVFTGLPPQTSIANSFQSWSATTQVECSQNPCLPTIALFTLPGWQASAFPDLTVLPLMAALVSPSQTVGPSGTLHVALIYGGKGMPNGRPATLHLHNLRLRDSNYTTLLTLTDITLTMPLG